MKEWWSHNKRCLWCGSTGKALTDVTFKYGKTRVASVCSESCQNKLENFSKYVSRYLLLMMGCLFGSIGIGVAVYFQYDNLLGGSIGLLGMGLTMQRWPFCTEDYINMRGVETATKFTKRLAIGMILFGALLGILSFIF